jgi:hypothetical protein
MNNDIYAPDWYFEYPEDIHYDDLENEFERINEDIYDTNKDNNEVCS